MIPGVGRVVRGEPFRARRLRDPSRRRDQPLDPDDPPARRPVPRARAVPARAVPRPRRARHVHVGAVRRRHPPLPGRELRARWRCASCCGACSSARRCGPRREPDKVQFRAITLAPKEGVRAIGPAPRSGVEKKKKKKKKKGASRCAHLEPSPHWRGGLAVTGRRACRVRQDQPYREVDRHAEHEHLLRPDRLHVHQLPARQADRRRQAHRHARGLRAERGQCRRSGSAADPPPEGARLLQGDPLERRGDRRRHAGSTRSRRI